MTRRRLGIVVSHPIQYQAPLFRYLATQTSIEPHVFFLTDHGVDLSYDPGFGRPIQYDVPLLEGFEHEFIRNWSPRPSPSTPMGTINPGLPMAIRRASLDVLLVHGWSNPSTWLACLSAATSGMPYLIRGEAQPDAPAMPKAKVYVKHALVGPLVRHAGACLAIGSRNRAFYREYGVASDRIFDAPYSVDTDRFSEAGDRGRLQRTERLSGLGLDPARPVVLFAAKLQSWKRPLDIVDALDQLDGGASLVVIGDGPLRAEVEARAAQRPWMRTLGFVNQAEIAEWYGIADLFVLPSDREPWGLAVNEAMAAGAIPIVSDAVGCGDDLVTPDVGWIFEVGNIKALAHALEAGCAVAGSSERRSVSRERSHQWGLGATARGIDAAVAANVGT